MIEKVITLVIGIMIALAGWTLSRTFELSTTQAVHDDKIDKLERLTEKLKDQMDNMMNMDEEIMQQHEDLFRQLSNTENSGRYSY